MRWKNRAYFITWAYLLNNELPKIIKIDNCWYYLSSMICEHQFVTFFWTQCSYNRPLTRKRIYYDLLTDMTDAAVDDTELGYKRLSYCRENQLKYWPTIIRITQTDRQSRVSVRSTFTNCHILFCYLQSFVHASLH